MSFFFNKQTAICPYIYYNNSIKNSNIEYNTLVHDSYYYNKSSKTIKKNEMTMHVPAKRVTPAHNKK